MIQPECPLRSINKHGVSILAVRGRGGDLLLTAMGFASRLLILDQDDGLHRLPGNWFAQMLREPSSRPVRRFAGLPVRFADIIVELIDYRKPARIVRLYWGYLRFDQNGVLDSEEFSKREVAKFHSFLAAHLQERERHQGQSSRRPIASPLRVESGPHHLKVAQPNWKTEAHRVVELQRRVQAVSMAFLQPVFVGKNACVLRGLQPAEDRITLNGSRQRTSDLEHMVGVTGRIVAWAQLRSAGRDGSAIADELIDFGRRRKWQEQLLSASQDCAEQVRRDAAVYNAAWDDGAFNG
jgi:hypothetical protein